MVKVLQNGHSSVCLGLYLSLNFLITFTSSVGDLAVPENSIADAVHLGIEKSGKQVKPLCLKDFFAGREKCFCW